MPMPERRLRLPYVGKTRFRYERGRVVLLPQRTFAAPADAIVWTTHWQAAAIDRGVFFERDKRDNHVRVIPMRRMFDSDCDAMNALEQAAFHGDEFSLRALAFVEQQDRFGYSGAWDRNVERWTHSLQWYKTLKADERASARVAREHFRAMARKRWGGPLVGACV